MTTSSTKTWESKRTDETRRIEALLGSVFEQADAYRYNSASIRIRVIDRPALGNRSLFMASRRRNGAP
jgi:hypothetical protein